MKKILLLIIGLTLAGAAFAKQKSSTESYNMARPREEVENGTPLP